MSLTTITSTTDLAPDLALESPVILVLDSATSQVSITVARGSQILATAGFASGERQSAQLLPTIDWLLARAGVALSDIRAFGAVVGPGGFTGLRVGLATIKGLAHARQLPVVAVSALALAARAAGSAPLTAVIQDAHRQDVFLQLFTVEPTGMVQALTEAVVLPLATAVQQAEAGRQAANMTSLLFTGNGVKLHGAQLATLATQLAQPYRMITLPDWQSLPGWTAYPGSDFLAAELVALTLAALQDGNTLTAQDLAAYYIRPADAEVKLQLGLIGKKRTSSPVD